MITHLTSWVPSGLCLALTFGGSAAFAQEQHGTSTGDLAKAAQNPIADMISVPLQSNFNTRVGPHDQLQYVLNIQPVVPITLNDEWNLITRWITPLISQPPLTVNGDREFGLGEAHHGKIEVDNRNGANGAVFRIKLPLD